TLKDVVSMTTGGPAPLLAGAPNVFIELGQVGITGSLVLANRGPGPNDRTAPVPAMAAASVPGAVGPGAGTDGGDTSSNANSGAAATGGGGGGQGADGDTKHASSAQPGHCQDGHPVDVITGRAYTLPDVVLELPGPLPLVLARTYSTAAAHRDVGLG